MMLRLFITGLAIAFGTSTAAQVPLTPAPPLGKSEARVPTIACGMKIFPADPSIDPLFGKPAPSGTFTMRALRSPMCQERKQARLQLVPERLPQFLGPKR
jgi:hypothetical protein